MFLEKWLTKRTHYYGLFSAIFLMLYGGIVYFLGEFPTYWVLAILAGSLVKDIADQINIYNGGSPIAWNDIEHNPSNLVLLAFIGLGVITLEGSTGGISNSTIGIILALADTALDGYQDFFS